MARLEFELAYYDSAVYRFNHYTTRTTRFSFIKKIYFLKKDKFWSSSINYHLTISQIYGLPKTHKPGVHLQAIISGIGTAPTRQYRKIFNQIFIPSIWRD